METTNQSLFDAAQSALIDQSWSVARIYLDELLQRHGLNEAFASPEAYSAPLWVADRINAVNALVLE